MASEARHALLRANTERIELAYEQAMRDGIDRPVVFVFDIKDETGRMMAEDVVGADVVGKQRELADRNGVDMCFLLPLPLATAARVVSKWPCKNKSLLDVRFPAGVFPVVIVSHRGVSWMGRRCP